MHFGEISNDITRKLIVIPLEYKQTFMCPVKKKIGDLRQTKLKIV
jgi:hypothetical protein